MSEPSVVQITTDDMLRKIGEQAVTIDVLRAHIAALEAALAEREPAEGAGA